MTQCADIPDPTDSSSVERAGFFASLTVQNAIWGILIICSVLSAAYLMRSQVQANTAALAGHDGQLKELTAQGNAGALELAVHDKRIGDVEARQTTLFENARTAQAALSDIASKVDVLKDRSDREESTRK